MRLIETRARAVERPLAHLYEGIERLLPTLEETGVRLALENLPSWESLPTEVEMEKLLTHFHSPLVRYWHDFGHAYTREQLGLTSHARWLERLRPFLVGCHVHDALAPGMDHLMPPRGGIDFSPFRAATAGAIIRVLEPAPGTAREDVIEGLATMQQVWGDRAPHEEQGKDAP